MKMSKEKMSKTKMRVRARKVSPVFSTFIFSAFLSFDIFTFDQSRVNLKQHELFSMMLFFTRSTDVTNRIAHFVNSKRVIERIKSGRIIAYSSVHLRSNFSLFLFLLEAMFINVLNKS